MATNFPASLDTLTNPTSSDSLNSPSHSAQHANSNDAIEALQAKVGVDSSAVTSSLDYKVAQLEAGVTGGKILQVVSATKTDTFTTTTSGWQDIPSLSVSITPSSASSKILLIGDVTLGLSNTGSASAFIRFSGGNSGDYVGDAASTRTQAASGFRFRDAVVERFTTQFSPVYLDSPATTSATTYKIQVYREAGTVYVNRNDSDIDSTYSGRFASSITVMEVSA